MAYLYRDIDKEGNQLLSDERDEKAAIKFFKQSMEGSGIVPAQISTDKENALNPAKYSSQYKASIQ